MAVAQSVPVPLHAGAEELSFVDLGGGNRFKVIQVKPDDGLWITEHIFMAGWVVPTHRHSGPSWGYTTSGALKYKEYDYVYRADSFVFEPAGSVHTLECLEDNTHGWTQMYGVTLDIDESGKVTSILDGRGALEVYYALCEAQDLPRPNVLVG